MLDPNHTPSDSPNVIPITPAMQSGWSESLKRQFKPKPDTSLEATLQLITNLFERSFGTLAPQPRGPEAAHSRMVMLFLRAINRITLEEAHRVRDVEPLAKGFLDRMDDELRRVIPTLSTEERALLLRSGYPLGTGTDSLTQHCIDAERVQNGAQGVVALFSKSHHTGDPTKAWSEDLLRAATTALSELSPTTVPLYMKGLKAMFSKSSPWASRALELFDGITDKVPLEVVIDIYDRGHQSKYFGTELKAALRCMIIDYIDRCTGGLYTAPLLALKESGVLPQIPKKVVAQVRNIAQARAEGAEVPRNAIEKLARHLPEWPFQAVPKKPEAPGNTEASPYQPQDLTTGLLNLTGEKFHAHLTHIIDQGLSDPSSETSMEFSRVVGTLPIQKLLAIRAVLHSSENIPESHTRAVYQLIQENLPTTLSKANAVTLAEVYELCVQLAAPQDEVHLVRDALRARLQLPQDNGELNKVEMSPAGRIVWRWIFSDLPPDSALISDIVRVHFSKMMTHMARSVSVGTTRGSAIDAVLHYAEELGLLKAYKPHESVRELPFWKLVFFTALVREQVGHKDGIVAGLMEVLCSRLKTEDARVNDAFPQQWARNENAAAIEALCGDIATNILKASPPPSFEEVSLVLTTARFLERRGPSQITRMYEQLRHKFVYEISRMDPTELQ